MIQFRPCAESFGDGRASVCSVTLCNLSGEALSYIVGGEMVRLKVVCKANADLYSPIVGFFVRDRLGQDLFGDNTYVTYSNKPLSVRCGESFRAQFEFRIPYLTPGEYSVCVAVASGTNKEHVQHQWINEAMLIRSMSTAPAAGIIGIPMRRITLEQV